MNTNTTNPQLTRDEANDLVFYWHWLHRGMNEKGPHIAGRVYGVRMAELARRTDRVTDSTGREPLEYYVETARLASELAELFDDMSWSFYLRGIAAIVRLAVKRADGSLAA